MRIRRPVVNLTLQSKLQANVQSLENKLDELKACISYQRDIQNCNILCFTESWLNDDMNNIQLAGFMLFWQDRSAASGKTREFSSILFIAVYLPPLTDAGTKTALNELYIWP